MFIKTLGMLGMLGVVVVFAALLVGMIFLFRFIIQRKGEQIIGGKPDPSTSPLDKKYYSVDINKYSVVLTNIGLALSFGLILAAFEFPNYQKEEIIDLGTLDVEMEELIEIPPTEQKPPPPPKIKQPEIVEVPDEEEIEEEIEIELDVELDEEMVVEEVLVDEEPVEEEVVDEIFEIVEDPAAPVGGMPAFYKFVQKNLKYPSTARRMGVEGKVYLQFVVDKDGTLTEIKVIRGIGAGCDEEAIRVLKKAPKWKPGKQRGRAVKQRMVFPINFKLG